MKPDIRWFTDARYGLFIHYGLYSLLGRGEWVMNRERIPRDEYMQLANRFTADKFDADAIIGRAAKDWGMKYAVLTCKHHEGFCLYDSQLTDFTAPKTACGRDLVREFVDACRKHGMRIALYHTLNDWTTIPNAVEALEDPGDAYDRFMAYVQGQIREIMTNYGKIDVIWFDGIWPRTAEDLAADKLVARMRALQPDILINNRLGGKESGDLGTPEHQIQAEDRLWESCQVTTWRLWGYTHGERWRPADKLLDMLCECAGKGGNLLLNVGPQADGQLPPEFVTRALQIGEWLEVHGEALYGNDGGDLTEFITRGWQTTKDNALYLIMRFWDGRPTMRLADLVTPVEKVELLTTGQRLDFDQRGEELFIHGLPRIAPTPLFPVIKITCTGTPQANQWGAERLWGGDPQRVADWARQRGTHPHAFTT